MVPSIGDENLFTRQKGDKGEKTQTSGLIDTFGSLPRILSSELLLFITIQTTTATTKHGTLKQAHLVALFSLSLSRTWLFIFCPMALVALKSSSLITIELAAIAIAILRSVLSLVKLAPPKIP